MPLQALFAVLQALVPLHELIPLQWTDLLIFLASAGLAAPLRTRAIARAPLILRNDFDVHFHLLGNSLAHERVPGSLNLPDAIRRGYE
jgi:hypothetical protein